MRSTPNVCMDSDDVTASRYHLQITLLMINACPCRTLRVHVNIRWENIQIYKFSLIECILIDKYSNTHVYRRSDSIPRRESQHSSALFSYAPWGKNVLPCEPMVFRDLADVQIVSSSTWSPVAYNSLDCNSDCLVDRGFLNGYNTIGANREGC
jgi:hypothetical protein